MIEELRELEKQTEEYRKEYFKQVGQRDLIQAGVKELQGKQVAVIADSKELEKVVEFLQLMSDIKKDELKNRIERLVTKGLQVVFDERYEFVIQFDIKSDQVFADFVVATYVDGVRRILDLKGSKGGGIRDIVSFLLRVVVLLFYKGKQMERFLALDEPFAKLSSDHEENVCALIKSLSDKMGIQFFIITHNDSLAEAGDVVYRVSQEPNGVSEVVKIG